MTKEEGEDSSPTPPPQEKGSYSTLPTRELPEPSPSKKSSMFDKRKSQDISWEDINFIVNKQIHVLQHVWG